MTTLKNAVKNLPPKTPDSEPKEYSVTARQMVLIVNGKEYKWKCDMTQGREVKK